MALMPAWNAASFIGSVLESLAAQRYANLDVLISDDASSDSTASICEDFAKRYPRFRIFRQPRNLGWVGNTNWLLGQARGSYQFFALHDDPAEPDYVARLVDALESNPRATVAFSDLRVGPYVRYYRDLENVTERVERGRRVIRKEGLWWIPFRGLFRAEAAAQVGGLRRHLGGEYGADWPWLLHLALRGEFIRVPEPLIRKNWRKEGLAMSWGPSVRKRFGMWLSCIREVRRAGLPLAEEAAVQQELGRYLLRVGLDRFTSRGESRG